MRAEPKIVSFGCRLNAYESEVMRDHALAADSDQLVIVNTCAVTGEAERQARQAIRKLRRQHPAARIVVTGCAAQLDPGKYAAMPEVDQVIGNAEKMRVESYTHPSDERIVVTDIMTLRETADHLVGGFDGRVRAFVEIQQGCDHRCTFCIIPFARGPNRSVPIGRIVEQIKLLRANGFVELVLTGVDIASYGSDLPGRPGLGQMVRRLLTLCPDLPRLRLSSLDPMAFDDELLQVLADEPRLMPHIHLSIQAGSDMILKRMKRRHSRADLRVLVDKLRLIRPDLALGADFITGFPTESEAMFEDSMSLVDELALSHLHVFPYSSRPGTPAARMPQLAPSVVRERAQRLRDKGQTAMNRFLASRIGKEAKVLLENEGFGHCEHYLPVRVECGRAVGEIITTRISGVAGGQLISGQNP